MVHAIQEFGLILRTATYRTVTNPPFLYLVARAYARHCTPAELAGFCFVFPNKRAGTFFLNHLATLIDVPYIEPDVLPVNDLLARLTPLAEASRYDQLFLLYREYCALTPVPVEFDRFIFWGEMLLGDFNDVDRYMVNPEALFVNLKRLREISADYLSDEQRELIRRYWGEDAMAMHSEIDRFWRHIVHDEDAGSNSGERLKDKFVALWEVLAPLYTRFTDALAARGLATGGRLSRMGAEAAADAPMPARRYVFVGFNVLNTAERVLFKHLKARGMADFYFDINSPAYDSPANSAARFVKANAAEFESLYPLDEEPIVNWPEIQTVGVPGKIGQAKLIGSMLAQMKADGTIANTSNAIDTAVVLPDESLFIPLLHSLPDNFGPVNVTMGFPLRLTPVASLLHQVVSLQRNMRLVRGRPSFFHENVRTLIAGPVLKTLSPDGVAAIERWLSRNHNYTVDAALLADLGSPLAPLFRPLSPDAGFEDTYRYIADLLDLMDAYVNPKSGEPVSVERCFIEGYRIALNELAAAIRDYGLNPGNATVFSLIERAVAGDRMQLVGEPVRGLQIMGMLETRSLDFSNIIIPSMNENIFPRRLTGRSFIPETLRHAYGMATVEFRESIFAYYFYRLISRADKVTILYDSRESGGTKESEPSRYVGQLRYMFPQAKPGHRDMVFPLTSFTAKELQIRKSGRVMSLLRRYLTPGSGLALSASALKRYISCPLGFYLEYVEGLGQLQEPVTYMDASTFGSVIHDALQRIYTDLAQRNTDGVITPGVLRESATVRTVSPYLVSAVNRCFFHLPTERSLEPLTGETKVLADLMCRMVMTLMEVDAERYAPLKLVEAERKYRDSFHIAEGLDINFTFIIDRLDRVVQEGNLLRIVDYKTGADKAQFSSVASLFDPDTPHASRDAVFQLLLYALLHDIREGSDEPIQPMLYFPGRLPSDAARPLSMDRTVITDHRPLMPEFREHLETMLRELFDPEVPFRATPHEGKSCRFCSFKEICGIDPQPEF